MKKLILKYFTFFYWALTGDLSALFADESLNILLDASRTFVLRPLKGDQIPGLDLDVGPYYPQIVRDTQTGKDHIELSLHGTFTSKKTRLYYERTKLMPPSTPEDPLHLPLVTHTLDGDDRRFKVKFTLESARQRYKFFAMDEDGKKIFEEFILETSKFEEFREKRDLPDLKRPHYNVGVGLSFIHYRQTARASYIATALTPRFGYQRYLGGRETSKWSFGISGFFNSILFSSSQPLVSARYLGINTRVIRDFPGLPGGWSFSVGTGIYYTTMFVSGRTFGYRNQFGPQLWFLTGVPWNGGAWMTSAFLKFSSITDGTKFLGVKNREIAGGLNSIFPRKRGDRFSICIDVSLVDLVVQNTVIQSQVFSGFLAYSW